MAIITDKKRIDDFLTRGVENAYPSRDFVKARLMDGKKLTVYLGVDPTGPSLHLGHAIPLMKMRDFQDLGHKVILLIGDFTAMIGDPTDKSAARKRLTRKEVLANARKYKAQAGKILRFSGANKAELAYNAKWLGKLSFADVVELASHTTVQRLEERDMFEKRREEGKPVFMHEFLYPIMQGYDSVAMDVDGEIGGNDQTFNMLVGRDFLKAMKKKEKFVLTTKLLADASGRKMGKTEGNMIALADSAEEMFGKVMSWDDAMIAPGFELLTRVPLKGVAEEAARDPRASKARLAYEIAVAFHGAKAADEASKRFDATFRKHEVPEDVPEFVVAGKKKINILDLLVESGLAASKGEARRLVAGGGVKADGHVIEGYDAEITPGPGTPVLIQKGKRHFVRVIKK